MNRQDLARESLWLLGSLAAGAIVVLGNSASWSAAEQHDGEPWTALARSTFSFAAVLYLSAGGVRVLLSALRQRTRRASRPLWPQD